MISQCQKFIANFDQDFLFDIAQDVENYPAFLPHCVAARILGKTDKYWIVDNIYRWGPISRRFTTHAHVTASKTIHISSAPEEAIYLNVIWTFTTLDNNQTEVSFEIGFSSSIPLLEKAVRAMLEDIALRTQQSFLKRADKLLKANRPV